MNEYQTIGLASQAFPALFPDCEGDPTDESGRIKSVSLKEACAHLLWCAKRNKDGRWIYPFASNQRFVFWAHNLIQRRQTNNQTGVFLRKNEELKNKTVEEIEDEVNKYGIRTLLETYECIWYTYSWK